MVVGLGLLLVLVLVLVVVVGIWLQGTWSWSWWSSVNSPQSSPIAYTWTQLQQYRGCFTMEKIENDTQGLNVGEIILNQLKASISHALFISIYQTFSDSMGYLQQ